MMNPAKPRVLACIRTCLAALACLDAGASESDADLLARLKPHLASRRVEERTTAERICVAIGSLALIDAAISASRAQPSLNEDEHATLVLALRALPAERLIREVLSQEPIMAKAAAEAMAGWPATTLTQTLEPMLTGSDAMTAERANKVLDEAFSQRMRTREQDEPGLTALALVRLRAGDARQRTAAITHLARAQFVPAVIDELARDRDETVRDGILARYDSLTQYTVGKEFAWCQRVFLQLCQDPSPAVRKHAITAYQHLCGYGQAGKADAALELPVVLALLDDPIAEIRAQACYLCYQHQEPEVAAKLERLCGDAEANVAHAAFASLTVSGRDCSGIASTLSSSPDPYLRSLALSYQSRSADKHVAGQARRLLEDSEYSFRAKSEDPSTSLLDESAASMISVTDPWGQRSKEMAELMIGLEPAERVAEFERQYLATGANKRRTLIKSLARVEWKFDYALEFMIRRVKDADPEIATAAILALQSGRNAGSEYVAAAGVLEALARVGDANETLAQTACGMLAISPYRALALEARLRRSAAMAASSTQAKRGSDERISNKDYEFDAWDDERARKTVMAAAADGDPLPDGAPQSSAGITALIKAYGEADAEAKPLYLIVIGRCDHPLAASTLAAALASADRKLRWTARSVLLNRGDASDQVIDFWLAGMLSGLQSQDLQLSAIQRLWPVSTPALLARLDTFKGLADDKAIATLRAEITKRIAAIETSRAQAAPVAVPAPAPRGTP